MKSEVNKVHLKKEYSFSLKICPYTHTLTHRCVIAFLKGGSINFKAEVWLVFANFLVSDFCLPLFRLQCSSKPPVEFSSVSQPCPTLCNTMNRSMPGLPVHYQLLEFTQIHVHRVGDAIQPSHPLSSPSPPASNPSQHQSLFQ